MCAHSHMHMYVQSRTWIRLIFPQRRITLHARHYSQCQWCQWRPPPGCPGCLCTLPLALCTQPACTSLFVCSWESVIICFANNQHVHLICLFLGMCGLWALPCDFVHHNYETLKWLSSQPILMQESFWWWQCSDRYMLLPLPPPPYPLPPLLPVPNKLHGFCGC